MDYSFKDLCMADFDSFFEHRKRMMLLNQDPNYPTFMPREESSPKDQFLKRMSEEWDLTNQYRTITIGVFQNASIVGHGDLMPYKLESLGHRVTLGIGIEKHLHGTGCAQALMQALIDRAKSLNYDYLDLGVFANNPKAVKLYQNFGFVKNAFEKDYFRVFGEKIDHICMALDLRENQT